MKENTKCYIIKVINYIIKIGMTLNTTFPLYMSGLSIIKEGRDVCEGGNKSSIEKFKR